MAAPYLHAVSDPARMLIHCAFKNGTDPPSLSMSKSDN
jgi:hypothetical protein